MEHPLHRFYSWFLSGIVGAITALPYLFWLNQATLLEGLGQIILFLYLWTLFTFATYAFFFLLILPRLRNYSNLWKSLCLASSLLAGFWLALNIPLRVPNPAAPTYLIVSSPIKLLFYTSAGVGLGLLLFALSAWLATLPKPTASPAENRRLRWLLYALPMVLIWGVYLLAFWPGMMSADSLDQWGQMASSQINDHHPAFHTFTLWLLSRLYPSPAVVALAQILALALLSGAILAFWERLGTPRPLLWLAAFVFALSPVNGTMVVTLWKDIFYSTALLGLTFLVFRTVQSGGEWLEVHANKVILGISAALVALLRHNGLPVAAGGLVAVILAFPRQWKPVTISMAVAAVLYFGIRGPVYQVVGVQKSTLLIESSLSFYTLAAYTAPETRADALFQSIKPLSGEWACDMWAQLGPSWREENLDRDIGFAVMAGNLAQRIPKVLLYNYSCRRSLVWIIWDPYGDIRNTSHTEVLIDPNPYGIEPDSRLPALRDLISYVVVKTAREGNINWLFWRPALYLYVFLFVMAVTALKHRKIQYLLPAVPLLIQSVASTMVLILPNYRYHYAAYLICLTFWPLLFARGGETSQPGMGLDEHEHG